MRASFLLPSGEGIQSHKGYSRVPSQPWPPTLWLPVACFSCDKRDGGVSQWPLGTVVTRNSSSFLLELFVGSCIYAFHTY